MFTQRAIFKQPCSEFLNGWVLRLSWAIACAAFPFPAVSEPVPIWANFTSENSDLPNNAIQALSSDSEDVLWIGTSAGLARVDKDGRWQSYSRASTKGGLPDNYVRNLARGADGTLWIGTDGGLARLNKNGHWQNYSFASTKGALPQDMILALAAGTDGTVWAGTEGGLARLDKDGRWQSYTKANTKNGLPSDRVDALAAGVDGTVWIGTDSGLARLDNDGHWQNYSKATAKGGLPSDDVFALALGTDGTVWIGTDSGLARLDKDGHWQNYSKATTKGGLKDASILALAVGPDGALWVGLAKGDGSDGLARLDKNGRWQSYSKASTNGSLPDDAAEALAFGADGVLWVGTRRGLARLNRNELWQSYTKANTKNGLPSDTVNALALGTDGTVWIGTDSGLARLDKDGHWQNYSKATTKGGLPNNFISELTVAPEGVLWVGTASGLARLNTDGHWQNYSKASTKGALPNDDIHALTIDSNGTIWIGTDGGLTRLGKDGHWQSYSKASTKGALPVDSIFALATASDGTLWIGTEHGGLVRRDHEGGWKTYIDELPSDTVVGLASAANGALWVATPRSGLARLDKDGRWQTFTVASTSGGLPNDRIGALALDTDSAIWIGTSLGAEEPGLARLDKDGRWQAYQYASTGGGLPNGSVQNLAVDRDGSLWIATEGGLANFRYPATPTHRIVDVIGEIGDVKQTPQTISVVAFDSSYRTEPSSFRYAWRLTFGNKIEDEKTTRFPVYRAPFKDDGTYHLQVNAIDRYGEWSKPQDIKFQFTRPKTDSTQELLWRATKYLLSSGFIYFALLFPLIPLYPHFSWARTAINSGIFTKFPLLHKTILNTRWARGYLFRQLAAKASGTELPKPYIPQSLFAAASKDTRALTLDGSNEGLTQFFAASRRALLAARSGTGKSVFLRHLQREVALRFRRGEGVPAPVLIDLRTHVLNGRKVQDLVRDAMHGAGVELADADLDFLIGKGGFLILADSLNELPDPADARVFHTFFNQDAGNLVLVASQVDLIRRQDTPLFNLAEVTPEQAASFLAEAVGREIYSELPQEAQALARNPQDLALLAEVAKALGTAHVPTHRAELYREILNQDGALRPWVESGDPLLAVIYGLAFRMVAERRVLQDGQLREWIAADPAVSGGAVAKVMQAMQASRLFRREMERNVLGKEQPVTGFRHELIGKFLAARHVRRIIANGANTTGVDYISLSGDELWLDMFYFVIDEIDSAPVLNRFLREILVAGGPARIRITAYAIGIRRTELGSEALASYEKAKLDEDLALTPAARGAA